MEITKREETEKGTREISEAIMTQNFSKLKSDTKSQIQGDWRTTRRINVKNLHLGIAFSNYRKPKIKKNANI